VNGQRIRSLGFTLDDEQRPLFDDRPREDAAYKRADETLYAFLDRVSQPELAAHFGELVNLEAHEPIVERDV
jgi:hypothetical protein